MLSSLHLVDWNLLLLQVSSQAAFVEVIFAFSHSSAFNEYRNISSALHQLSSHDCNCNPLYLKQLESFSLQLMTTKIQFTAKRFFDISNGTLRGVKIMNSQIESCVLNSRLSFRFCQQSQLTFLLWSNLCRVGASFRLNTKWTSMTLRIVEAKR